MTHEKPFARITDQAVDEDHPRAPPALEVKVAHLEAGTASAASAATSRTVATRGALLASITDERSISG